MMKKKPVIHSRLEVARSRLFRIESLEITFPNGIEVQYERLISSGNGAVLIIPMQDDSTVLLVREYAAGTEQYELALPKGRIEADENPVDAANRELSEEIGLAARRLTLLTAFTLAPGYMSHATHVVLAEDLYPQEAEGDEPEPLEVVPWKLDQLYGLTQREDCSEARSIAALYLARDYLEQR
ncbi:MAG TPA: ADP compounds hydrolase NudE [Chromatiales bacterium]|nr:ADP compounds hydrolase NudE [Thiotrichales bacterium]HIP69336.1 ADP compounds hydrolase NudE [Chromatiales bacterium]